MQQPSHDQSEMRVRDIMTTPVHTVKMDDPLLAAKKVFDRKHCHHAVVLEENRVVGVISDRDVLKAVSPFVGIKNMERTRDLSTLQKRIHQVMSRSLVVADVDESVVVAAARMQDERISCLPVVDEAYSPLGILTIRDFVACVSPMVREPDTEAIESEYDSGIFIIIDGERCYTPHTAIGNLIRQSEKTFEQENGPGSACVKLLPSPHETACAN